MTGLFSLDIYNRFSCRIPRVDGNGYLKSAFGGHRINASSRKWDDFKPDFCGDLCDIDGYLCFDIGSCFGNDKIVKGKAMRKALEKVFPRIKKWKQVSIEELFYA